jgi:hypothetical protein
LHLCTFAAPALCVSGFCPTQARHAGFGGHKRRRQMCGPFGLTRADPIVACYKAHGGWAGPLFPIIYTRARRKAKTAAFDWPELYSTAARRRCHLSSPTSRACQADSLSAVTPGTTPGHASRGQIFCIFAEDYRYDVIFARPLHLCQLAVVPRGERRALDPRSVCGFLRIDRRVASRRM